jgi:thiol-disulfide isomerase/thioredoxin
MKTALLIMTLAVLAACDSSSGGLQAHRGQWVLVNYWAKWCKPCIKEIPELNELDHSRDDVTVLGVNYDGLTGADLEAQLTELGVEFTTLEQDPAPLLGVARPVVLPTTFLLDPEGKLVATLVGPQTLQSLSEAVSAAGG